MRERINRKDDESLYQPKIHSERIRELYVLKVATGLPMTVLVDLAIRQLIERSKANHGMIFDQNDNGARAIERTELNSQIISEIGA